MKLKNGFVTEDFDGQQVMVGVGPAAFSGIVRSNETAAFIVNCLKKETTKEEIVAAMAAEYDAPVDRIAADLEGVLAKLRSIGALDE